MNGFTWSAKGDLVPVCCRNAVGNTSPRSAKARRGGRYITRLVETRIRRARAGRLPLNYLVGPTRRFCLSYQTTPISRRLKRGEDRHVSSPTSTAVQMPRRWPRLNANISLASGNDDREDAGAPSSDIRSIHRLIVSRSGNGTRS